MAIRALAAFSLAAMAIAIGSAKVVPEPSVLIGTHESTLWLFHNHTHQAADLARTAAEVCGALSVEEALRAVAIRPAAARRGGKMLAQLGFDTALDLKLLGGGKAAAEVLAELKIGGLGPADRAKVRLLVGDREHLQRLSSSALWAFATAADGGAKSYSGSEAHLEDREGVSGFKLDWTMRKRHLQSTDAKTSGMSADTIAIVLSVLVGAVGYVVQVSAALLVAPSCMNSLCEYCSCFVPLALITGVHSSTSGAGTASARAGAAHSGASSAAGAPDYDGAD
eukprot:SAG31_NODE_104_length_25069_cov_12.917144_1_plen_281_part_00